MSDRSQRPGIVLMGQVIEWPANAWGAAAFIALSAVFAFAAYLIFDFAMHAPKDRINDVHRLWTSVRYGIDNKALEKPEGVRKIEFWTPSSKTAPVDATLEKKDEWERGVTEEKVAEFGEKLRALDLGVTGFRRWEVLGHGRTAPKAGWWWSMTVKSCFEIPRFLAFYREYWGSPDSIYMEITQTDSDYRD